MAADVDADDVDVGADVVADDVDVVVAADVAVSCGAAVATAAVDVAAVTKSWRRHRRGF